MSREEACQKEKYEILNVKNHEICQYLLSLWNAFVLVIVIILAIGYVGLSI